MTRSDLQPPPPGRSPPRVRELRARLRRARRKHHDRSLGDLLSDLYTLLWLAVVYGGALAAAVRRHFAQVSPGASSATLWITAAVVLAGTGLTWRGMGALGPLFATPAEQSWAVSTPVDRRGWLLPRLVLLLLGFGAGAAVLACVVGLGLRVQSLGWATLAAALFGVALPGASVAAQGRGEDRRWSRLAGSGLALAGVAVAAWAVAAHYLGRPLSSTGLPPASVLASAGAPLALLSIVGAFRTLPHLDLASLSAGAQLATATFTATIGLDPSLLSGLLEVRHWRRVARVSSRPFRWGHLGRTWVLLQAELRRQVRRPGALGAWAAVGVAQYAVVLVAPAVAGVAHLILAYVATNRLTSGLRTLARAPGLRRALGGEEVRVRLAHLVIPALGTVVWWLATWPVSGGGHTSLDLFLIAGIVAAAYRAATRRPLSYGGVVMETPFGLLPIDLVVQLARGPDVLGAVIVLRFLSGG